MKITIRVLAAAAMLAAASSPAFAQGGGGGGNMQERQAAQRAMLFEGITLSDEQKTKIDSISAAATKERTEARASMGEDRQAWMQKNMEIMTKERDAIKKVLTPEQVTQFEANIAKMPQMGRGRGGR
jgi:Spy/CpxP family protein refolding chaperone